MSHNQSIHTLDARGHLMLELVRDHFKLPPERMRKEIQGLHSSVVEALGAKGIRYEKLKTALVPDRKRREVAFVFDTLEIEDSWYGGMIFRHLFPLFQKDSNHSVLAGDYIDTGAGQDALFRAFAEAVACVREVEYRHSSQFYVVYVNNLTDNMAVQIHEGLSDCPGYVGLADTTYSSPFKTLLSMMLVNAFLKHRSFIIQGHEDDRPNSEDVDMYGLPAEENGYVCRSVQSMLFGPLLSYKIERPVFPGFEVDTEMSLNSISDEPLPLSDFDIEVGDARVAYLKSEKAGVLEKAGLENVTSDQLAELVAAKVQASYIYNLSYVEEHDVAKFNVMLEIPRPQDGKSLRLLAALKYKPASKSLQLVTLY